MDGMDRWMEWMEMEMEMENEKWKEKKRKQMIDYGTIYIDLCEYIPTIFPHNKPTSDVGYSKVVS